MNFSVTNLAVIRSISRSTLFGFGPSKNPSFFDLSKSSFKQISGNVLRFINSNRAVKVTASNFQKTLSSAIVVDSMDVTNSFVKNESARVLNGQSYKIEDCVFIRCNGTKGGAISSTDSSFSIKNSYFVFNKAEVGGAISCINSSGISIENSLFAFNSAEYTGATNIGSKDESNSAYIKYVNLTGNRASKWVGAMRVDRDGGSISNCVFSNNSAFACGGFFDFSCQPCERYVASCLFERNNASIKGGAYCCFHIKQRVSFDDCVFSMNMCDNSADSIAIESVDIKVTLNGCCFSSRKEEEISTKFNQSELEENNVHFNYAQKIAEKVKVIVSNVEQEIPKKSY